MEITILYVNQGGLLVSEDCIGGIVFVFAEWCSALRPGFNICVNICCQVCVQVWHIVLMLMEYDVIETCRFWRIVWLMIGCLAFVEMLVGGKGKVLLDLHSNSKASHIITYSGSQ